MSYLSSRKYSPISIGDVTKVVSSLCDSTLHPLRFNVKLWVTITVNQSFILVGIH